MTGNQARQIQELLTKGVENIYPGRVFLEQKLKSGQKLTVYQGFDPTADALHIGNSVGLIKLKQFQDLGHRVIFLIGDYTAMIGDPDKKTARKPLSREEVLTNCKDYQNQAAKILNFQGSHPVTVKYNSQWLAKLNFAETLQLLTNFTVQRMLERDLFEQRIKTGNPLYLHEFMYPVMQAYDSVIMNVDGEIGGNDQTFNMLAGRDLMKALKNKEKFVLTMKLLEDPTGKKMGKTEGNMVRLDESPKEMFGKIMSWPDELIALGFELITFYSMAEVEKIKKQLEEKKINPRELKAKLASKVVTIYHSKKTAGAAEMEFNKIFRDKDKPKKMDKIFIMKIEYKIVDLILAAGLTESKSAGKRLVEQAGVKLNNETIRDWQEKIKPKNGDVLQGGKRKFVRLLVRK